MFIATSISYAYVLNNDFLGDDVGRILGNTELATLSDALTGDLGDRPLLMFFMWLEATLLGLGAVGMRLFGIFFHSLVAFQIYQLIKELTDTKSETSSDWPAFLLAMTFALHPLNNQTINLVIQHGVIFASLFCLLSVKYFFRYMKSGLVWQLVASLLTMCLAMMCKPIASFLPLFYIFVSLKLESKQIKQRAYLLLYFLPLLIPLGFYLLLGKNSQDFYSLNTLQYFQIQLGVVASYLKMMLFPYGMQFLYDVYPSNMNWLFLFLHAGIILLAWKFLKEKISFIFFVGFYLAFIPESSFFPIIHSAFDHRTYLPMVFLFISLGTFLIRNDRWKKIYVPVMSLILLAYVGLNQVRNLQIKPETSWMMHTLDNAIQHHNFNFHFCMVLLRAGKIDEVGIYVNKYKVIYKDLLQYKVLFLIYDYIRNPADKENLINNFTDYMKLGWDGAAPRQMGNEYLVHFLDRPDSTLEELLQLEDVLSMQMKIFFVSHLEKHFNLQRQSYQSLAHRLLKKEDELKLNHSVDVLRMKAILYYYYNEKFPGLKEEIETSLAASPESPVLKRLLEMANKI